MAEEDELEALRQRKMQELQVRAQQEAVAQEQAKQVDAQRQMVMRQILTPEARERLANLRMTRPDVVDSVESQLIMLVQSGRITQQIDDYTLRQILRKVMPQKREIKIERRWYGEAQATREEAQAVGRGEEQQEGPSLGDDEDEQEFSQAPEAEALERVFTIPLTITKQVPRTKRAPRAIKEIKDYVRQHMTDKSADKEEREKEVWIDYRVNELIWSKGIENPPSRVRVKAIRFEDGLIEVSLPEE
jgi:programmed cell death protein 5